MIIRQERDEAIAIIEVMMKALTTGLAATGRPGAVLRRAIGDLLEDAAGLIKNGTIGTELFSCFEQAREAGTSLANLDTVRKSMMAEDPIYDLGVMIRLSGMVFSLVEQCKTIAKMTFVSRTDVETIMDRMLIVIDDVKLEASEILNGVDYQDVVSMSAALVQHLAATERQLPRIVVYDLPNNLPSLSLSNYIYGTADRSDELIDENKIVHPAFCPREISALSE